MTYDLHGLSLHHLEVVYDILDEHEPSSPWQQSVIDEVLALIGRELDGPPVTDDRPRVGAGDKFLLPEHGLVHYLDLRGLGMTRAMARSRALAIVRNDTEIWRRP